jgi:hypothetical protein
LKEILQLRGQIGARDPGAATPLHETVRKIG